MSAFGKINSGERPETNYDKSSQAKEQAILKLEDFLSKNEVSVRITGSNSMFFSIDKEQDTVGMTSILNNALCVGAVSFSLETDEEGVNYEVHFVHQTDLISPIVPEFFRNHLDIFRKSIQSEVAGVKM